MNILFKIFYKREKYLFWLLLFIDIVLILAEYIKFIFQKFLFLITLPMDWFIQHNELRWSTIGILTPILIGIFIYDPYKEWILKRKYKKHINDLCIKINNLFISYCSMMSMIFIENTKTEFNLKSNFDEFNKKIEEIYDIFYKNRQFYNKTAYDASEYIKTPRDLNYSMQLINEAIDICDLIPDTFDIKVNRYKLKSFAKKLTSIHNEITTSSDKYALALNLINRCYVLKQDFNDLINEFKKDELILEGFRTLRQNKKEIMPIEEILLV